MVRRSLGWLALFVALLVARPALAAYTPPPLQGAITDTSGKVSASEKAAIESRLAAYRARTTNEVVVFLPRSLDGESIEDVAYGAFNTWKIGKAKTDNGVLLVIAPAEHKMRIETGKGIGDKLTDLESSHILRDRIGPLLKQDRYNDAINAGLDGIEAALDGRSAPPLTVSPTSTGATTAATSPPITPYTSTPADLDRERELRLERERREAEEAMNEHDARIFEIVIVVILVGIFIFLLIVARRNRSGAFRDWSAGNSSWSSSSSSSWTSSSSSYDGGSSFSSGSSDTFSGGGGSSGGGGASDSW